MRNPMITLLPEGGFVLSSCLPSNSRGLPVLITLHLAGALLDVVYLLLGVKWLDFVL